AIDPTETNTKDPAGELGSFAFSGCGGGLTLGPPSRGGLGRDHTPSADMHLARTLTGCLQLEIHRRTEPMRGAEFFNGEGGGRRREVAPLLGGVLGRHRRPPWLFAEDDTGA